MMEIVKMNTDHCAAVLSMLDTKQKAELNALETKKDIHIRAQYLRDSSSGSWALLLDGKPLAAWGIQPVSHGTLTAWALTQTLDKRHWVLLLRHSKMVRDMAFTETKVTRIQSYLSPRMPKAIQYAKKLGMKSFAKLKAYGAGGHDFVLGAITREDWELLMMSEEIKDLTKVGMSKKAAEYFIKTGKLPPVAGGLGGGGGGDGGVAQARADQQKKEAQQQSNIGAIRGTISGGDFSRLETDHEIDSRESAIQADKAARLQQLKQEELDLFRDQSLTTHERNLRAAQIQSEIASVSTGRGIIGEIIHKANPERRSVLVKNTGPTQEDRINEAQQAVQDFLLPFLTDQRELAERRGKFQLLRQGVAQGSQGVDFRRETQKRFDKGLEEIATRKLQAGDDVRRRDASLENNLISQALANVGRDTLISQANAGLAANANAAQTAARDQGIDEQFNNAGNLFSNIALNQGLQDGSATVASLLGKNRNRTSFNSTSPSTGRVTQT